MVAANTNASSQNAARRRGACGAGLTIAGRGRGSVMVVVMLARLAPAGVSGRHTAGGFATGGGRGVRAGPVNDGRPGAAPCCRGPGPPAPPALPDRVRL